MGALRVCRSRVSAPVAPKAVTATGSGSRSDSESEAWWRGGRERLPSAEGGLVEDGREEGVELEGLEARENFFMVKGPGGPLEEDIVVLGACGGGVGCGGPLCAGIETRLAVESVCLRMDECDGAGRTKLVMIVIVAGLE